jgi:hypothetical protein
MSVPPDCRPATDDEIVVELLAGPDSFGRHQVFVYWNAECVAGCEQCEGRGCGQVTTRGQIFWTNVERFTRPETPPSRVVDHR